MHFVIIIQAYITLNSCVTVKLIEFFVVMPAFLLNSVDGHFSTSYIAGHLIVIDMLRYC